MIFGNINHEKTYSNLSKDLLTCFEYTKKNSLADFEKGSYKIDGNEIFVNIVGYETCEKEDRFWEAHKKYIDVHLLLEGSEKIADLNFNSIPYLQMIYQATPNEMDEILNSWKDKKYVNDRLIKFVKEVK